MQFYAHQVIYRFPRLFSVNLHYAMMSLCKKWRVVDKDNDKHKDKHKDNDSEREASAYW